MTHAACSAHRPSARSVLLGGGMIAVLCTGSAQAKDWVVAVGARVSASPPYEGANYNLVRPSPTLSIRPANQPYRFTPPDGGATLAIIDSDHFSFGPIVRFRYKRDSNGTLAGFDEVKFAAEPGVFAELWPTNWLRGRAELRHGVGGHKGLVADVGGDLVYTGTRWDASIGPRFGWGDRTYITEYFGVTAQEAQRSPLIHTPYQPTAGRRYTGIEVAGAYHLDSNWTIKADVGYRRLADKAAASPIVRVAGKTDQYLASVGLSYAFGLRL